MEKAYWTGRKRAAMPFMLPDKGPTTSGERAALQLRLPQLRPARKGDGQKESGR